MSDRQFRVNISAPNLLNICLDCLENGEMKGRIYHCYQEEPVKFVSVVELITIAESLFEEIQHPQASTKTRTFEEKTNTYPLLKLNKKVSQEDLIQHRGEKGTFILHVQFRQGSTWQGELSWIEKEEHYQFHNLLEFIKIMDQVDK